MRRVNCDRYPCHFQDQDCTFCFCPFYPCLEEKTGGHFKEGKWCCEKCTSIHQKNIANSVMDALINGEELAQIWKRVVKDL